MLTTPKIAVLGSAHEPKQSEVSKMAFQLGREIAKTKGIVLTGGCPGLPHRACLGARSVGGLTVAVSPAMNRKEHVDRYCYPYDSDVTMFTGMGNKGRNVILVRSADIALFIGGGIGTLNEFTIAFDDFTDEKVIGILSGSGGISDQLSEIALWSKRTPTAPLLIESDPTILVLRVFQKFANRICPDLK